MTRPPRPELMALLADAKDNPDDQTTWLVLTDWLEEYGDEADRARAEYCRLCLDRFGKKTYASDWEKGERRRELARRYAAEWFGPVLALQPQVRKGLVKLGKPSWSAFEARVPALLRDRERWEWVEALRLEFFRLHGLVNSGAASLLTTLRTLSFDGHDTASDEWIELLCGCEHLARLRSLSFEVHHLSLSSARLLAACPSLRSLCHLSVCWAWSSDLAVRETLEARFGQALRLWP